MMALLLLFALQAHQFLAVRKLQNQGVINNDRIFYIAKEIENDKTSLVGLHVDTLISLMGSPTAVRYSKLSELLDYPPELEYICRARLLSVKYNLSARGDVSIIEWTYNPPPGYGGRKLLICIDEKTKTVLFNAEEGEVRVPLL
jgi:hypothetical protein